MKAPPNPCSPVLRGIRVAPILTCDKGCLRSPGPHAHL